MSAPSEIGLRWHDSGQASLSGPLLALADDLDLAFQALAGHWAAQEERHPSALPVGTLKRVGYLGSFPHQATFAVPLEPAEGNLARAAEGSARPGPLTDVLTPAACYHVYAAHQGEALTTSWFVTTRATCFRREREYEPLRRQWAFTMREVVCLGAPEETTDFLDRARSLVDGLAACLDLPIDWVPATDPFFRPHTQPGFLLQKVQPVKHEATYRALAIGSANLHHDHFGAAFGIRRGGRPAHSACLAFGLERWLSALLDRHGTDPRSWPDPLQCAGVRA